MSEQAPEIGEHDLDVSRLQGLLDEELAHFLRDFDVSPLSEVQELRSYFIAWMAVFLPEVVTPTFRARLQTAVVAIRDRTDILGNGWYRALPLDAALFALTGDLKWLFIHITNLDHHNSSLRNHTLESLSMVADRLNFADPELQHRAENSLAAVHFGCEHCVIMLMVTRGSAQMKRDWIRNWLSLGRFLNPHQKDVLERLAVGQYVPNPFLVHFLWIQQYVCLRLAEMRYERPAQQTKGGLKKADATNQSERITGASRGPAPLPLFSEKEDERLRQGSNTADLPLGQRMWQRLRNHPLMASHIHLEGIQSS